MIERNKKRDGRVMVAAIDVKLLFKMTYLLERYKQASGDLQY